MRSPEFAAYIGPARLYPELWRLALGLLVIVFVYLGFTVLVLAGLFGAVGPMNFFPWLLKMQEAAEPGAVLLLLVTFGGLLFGAILATAACHFRGPGTLFGPAGDTVRGFFTALGVVAPIYAILFAVAWWVAPPEANLAPARWLRLLPLTLPLLLVQITAEELVFRGYLQQQLAARFRGRWVWMGLPAVAFAGLHWNPAAGATVWLILAATLAFALVAADLTERTGSLGAAMGLHFGNNVLALTLLATDGTITGLALYVTPQEIGASGGSVALSLLADILVLAVVWRLLRAVLAR